MGILTNILTAAILSISTIQAEGPAHQVLNPRRIQIEYITPKGKQIIEVDAIESAPRTPYVTSPASFTKHAPTFDYSNLSPYDRRLWDELQRQDDILEDVQFQLNRSRNIRPDTRLGNIHDFIRRNPPTYRR